jgi:formate hydrogenlyase subunit 3/multisubunit Na+/H+ antiporter MnhD subunit
MFIISWLARGLLIAAGFVASWFMTRDSLQFGLLEMAVALLLVVFIVAVLAFWPERWTHILNRLHKPR